MMVSFRTFKILSNKYFLNDLCQTWSPGRHLSDLSIAVFWKSLTVPNVDAFILSSVLIALMGFARVGAAFYTETADDCT